MSVAGFAPFLIASFVIATSLAGCSVSPPVLSDSPTPQAGRSLSPLGTPSTTASPSSGTIDLAASNWYQVIDWHDTNGRELRELLIGTLAGDVTHSVGLNQLAAGEVAESVRYRSTYPQASGIFDGSALVWGREQQPAVIERIDLASGTTEVVFTAADPIHVATADPTLTTIAFITVDPEYLEPTGLWVDDLGDESEPIQLTHSLSEAIGPTDRYRLAMDSSASLLGVEAPSGTVSLISIDTDQSADLGGSLGPILGFASDHLIAYGARAATDRRPVVAFDPDTLNGRELIADIDAARLVPTPDGAVVAAMRIDPQDALAFEIGVASLQGPETWPIYTHGGPDIGALLIGGDRAQFAAELPPGWVMVADSPAIYARTSPVKGDPPASSFPFLLDVATGEVVSLHDAWSD